MTINEAIEIRNRNARALLLRDGLTRGINPTPLLDELGEIAGEYE